MLNQIVLVGRLVRDPEVKKAKNGSSYSYITLAIPRTYKNVNGEYETDFIDCTLWKLMATNTKEYCKKGDIVGVKGRLESKVYEKDGEKKYVTEVIAERVTFLSSNNKENQELNEETDEE
ncbi:MAG: single-stranded DNA-binding protein [Bacilli bacterium]